MHEDRPDELTRRGLLAAGAGIGAVALLPAEALARVPREAKRRHRRRHRHHRRPARRPATAPSPAPSSPALGHGGAPTDNVTLARLAREHGAGEPLMFADLAAVDSNSLVITSFARANRWAVRPALKAFQSPRFCAYVLGLLPEPRGLIFHLRQVDQVLTAAPPGTDLLTGYPPTRGELRAFLGRRAPSGQPPHRLRILVSSVDLLQEFADLARTTPRPLPLEVGLEFDSGEGRGGFHKPADISAALALLRSARDRLRLTAVLCYDGHATLNGDQHYRQGVATQARSFYAGYLQQLEAEGADLFDAATLVRNGPASSNYRNWAGSTECNEISPGSAFSYPGYLDSFDHDGLASALAQCAPVLKVIGPYPAVPVTKIPVAPANGQEEYFLKGSSWPDGGGTEPAFIYPNGVNDDQLEGGRAAVYAPAGSLGPEDYVLCRPNQAGDGIDYFGAVTVVRSGQVLTTWPTFSRWSAPAGSSL
ncbi:MAG TPA: alanine racemase [Solirubrobacteraceae bacterium]|nr:alanine racemase [Solirubrobacteraceae bacterium]